MPFGALAFVGLVPLLFALEFKPKHTFLLLYITFFIYHAGSNWWISSWQENTDPYLVASGIATALIHPFFFFFPFLLYFFVKKRLGTQRALWFLPFFWASFEWLHGLGDLAYPWLALSYTQLKSLYWVQFADITGSTGVSFVIVLINILVLKSIYVIKSYEGSQRKIKNLLLHPLFLKYAIPLFLLIVLPYVYGIIRIRDFKHGELLKRCETVNLGIIQPAINPWNKWETSSLGQIQKHIAISDSLVAATGKLDALIWSETAILYVNYDVNFLHDFAFLRRWMNNYNFSLISGFADMKLYKKGETPSIAAKAFRGDSSMIYDSYNSVLLLNPDSTKSEPQIYHKMRLTPFGERIPYMEVFSFARKWLEWGVGISSWAKGKEQKLLTLETANGRHIPFAPVICIESIYPGFVRGFVEKGAEFITIITNDAWYDHTFGPEQHYQIARMRAIETRRYIARCANTGVSGFIQAGGETLLRAPQYKATGIAATIPLLQNKSYYDIYGDWIVYISLFISFFVLVFSLVKQK
jgi:apolipoprotein N-acyltransferase